MSFMRAMSSGVMFCIAPLIWSTICCISCWRSLSISCSKRCAASADSKSYADSSRTLPARSFGQHVEAEVAVHRRRRVRPRRGARRRSPRPPCVAFSMAWRSSSTMSSSSSAISSYTPPRSNRSSRSWRSWRSLSISSRRPCRRSPLRSCMPCCIIRRSALLMSPWYSRSSFSSSNSASASRSKPFCVPSQREYVNRAAMSGRYSRLTFERVSVGCDHAGATDELRHRACKS